MIKQLLAILLLCVGVTGYGQSLPCVADSCCLEGTIWDEELGGCVVANPSDTDFDGCVGIGDFLVHLSNFGIGCGAQQAWTCGDPIEYQGYYYDTVQIGEQCWFAENLRSVSYENGDTIPSGLSDSEWENTTSGAVTVYGEGSTQCFSYSPNGDACDEFWSLYQFGRLYNWYAIEDPRRLCPWGWHVPSDEEWMTMELSLGMSETEVNNNAFRGTDQGTQMKTTNDWYEESGGTNSSGFSGLPGGFRSIIFGDNGRDGYWWSSSNDGSYRGLSWVSEGINRNTYVPIFGFSVRCIQDSAE